MKNTPEQLIDKAKAKFDKDTKSIVDRFKKVNDELDLYIKAALIIREFYENNLNQNCYSVFHQRYNEMWKKWKKAVIKYQKEMRPHNLKLERKCKKIRNNT